MKKKFTYFLVLLSISLFFSCSKNKEILPQQVSSLSFNQSIFYMEIGQVMRFSFSHSPENLPVPELEWESSDPTILSFEQDKATALQEGKVTITARVKNTSIKRSIEVSISPVKVQSVEISPSSQIVVIGSRIQLTAKVLPENTGNKNIIWTSNNHNVATVNSKGLVTTYAKGLVEITATSESGLKTAICKLDVSLTPVSSIETDSKNNIRVLLINEIDEVKTTISPIDATNPKLTWESNYPNIVQVDQTGRLKGISKGTAKVTVASESNPTVKNTISVLVIENPNELFEVKISNSNFTNVNGSISGYGTISTTIKYISAIINTLDIAYYDEKGKTLSGPTKLVMGNNTNSDNQNYTFQLNIQEGNKLINVFKPYQLLQYSYKGKSYTNRFNLY